MAFPILLAWDAVNDPTVTNYQVGVGRTSGAYTESADAGNALSYTYPFAAPGTWFVAIRAQAPDGFGPYGTEFTVTVGPTASRPFVG